MLGLRLCVHDVLRFSTRIRRMTASYQFFGDLLARFAVLPTACRKWPATASPVLRIAKYPGDWERGSDHSPLRRLQLLFRVVDQDFPARSALLAPRGNEELPQSG